MSAGSGTTGNGAAALSTPLHPPLLSGCSTRARGDPESPRQPALSICTLDLGCETLKDLTIARQRVLQRFCDLRG